MRERPHHTGRVRDALPYLTYPTVMTGALLLWSALLQKGAAPALAGLGAQLAAAVAVAGLEQLLPYSRDWQKPRGDRLTDSLHLAASVAISGGLVRVLSLTTLCGLAGQATERLWRALPVGRLLGAVWPRLALLPGETLWPSSWPLFAQLVLALIVAELGGYATHRLLHAWPRCWAFHAVHHSALRLYFLNASRNHPLDTALSLVASTLPLIVLGAGDTLFSLFGACTGAHLLLQHGNVAQRTGPLNYVLSTAEVHRWHHSTRRSEADANYGHVLLLWDLVFGTRRVPLLREPPLTIGLADGGEYPTGYLAQLAAPFRWFLR